MARPVTPRAGTSEMAPSRTGPRSRAATRLRRGARRLPGRLATLLVLAWVLFPLYWAVVISLKPALQLYQAAFIPFVQFQPVLDIWQHDLAAHGGDYLLAMCNSLVVATSATVLALLLGTLAGYGLARFRFRPRWSGNAGLMVLLVLPRLVPPAALVTPYFLLFRTLHLLDNLVALVLVDATLTLPFCVVVTYDLVRQLDREGEESAWIDGCSRWRAFWRIIWPQLGAARFALFAICFAFTWNEYVIATTLTEGASTVMPAAIQVQEDWEMPDLQQFGPRLLMTLIPPLLLALVAQRALVAGFSLGLVRRR